MNKITLLLIASFFTSISYSQKGITITVNDLPNAPTFGQGDTIRYSTALATTAGIDVTKTDTNYTWDFSFLQASGQGVNEYKKSTLTAYSLLGVGFNAIGLKQPDVNLQVVKFTNAYEFYNRTTTEFEAKATGYTISGIPLASTYSNTDKIYQFPLNYADVDSDEFHYSLSIANVPGISISFKYIRDGKRKNEVDGYGKIITPFGTFQCIRVKSTITETDSIDFGFGVPIGIPNNRIEYKWLANGIKIPVLEIDGTDLVGTFTITSIKYRDNYRFLAPRADFKADTTYTLRWQPVNFTNLSSSASTGSLTNRWTITPDSMFTFINGTLRNSKNPIVSFNVDTVFTVKLKVTNSSGSDSLTKTEYIRVGHEIAGFQKINAENNLHVFPNPTTNKLIVLGLNDVSKTKNIQAISVEGQEIDLPFNISENNLFIDVSMLPKGSYLLNIKNSQSVFYNKFVKVD